jgi:UDP-glucose 4-epimerase
MKCLVLGGGGFIGSHLIDALLAEGHKVRCFDRSTVASRVKNGPSRNKNFELYQGEFLSEEDVASALSGCDVCFHLISTTLPQSSNADPAFDVESNVVGTIRLLTHAVKAGLKKIIFASSGGTVYGIPLCSPIPETHPTNPICSYGISKLAIEKYLELFRQLYGLEYCILRISNPFGERQRLSANQGAIAVFLGKILRDEEVVIWGDGSAVRDYIYIEDVIKALKLSLSDTYSERIFNIGSGSGYSINELLRLIERVTGQKLIRKYLPARQFDVPVSVLCANRAKSILGWSADISLEQGVERVFSWVKEKYNDD